MRGKHVDYVFRVQRCIYDPVSSALCHNGLTCAQINRNIKCAYLLSHLPNERDEEVDGVLHT